MGHGNGWPSPYTYDPNYTTKDGFGLNATCRRGRLQQQVLRRAVRRDARPRARTRSSCSTTCATPRATPSRATPSRPTASRASAPTTTPRASSRPVRAAVIADGHSGPWATTPRPVHDPPVDRGHVADRAEHQRPRRSRSLDADPRRRGLPGSRGARRPGSTARSSAGPTVTTDEVTGGRRHRRRSGGLVVPGHAAVSTDGRRSTPTSDDGTRPTPSASADLAARDPPPRRRRSSPARRRRRRCRGRGLDDPRSRLHAGHRPRAARQHGTARRRSASSRAAVLTERRRPGRQASSARRFTELVALDPRASSDGDRTDLFEATGDGADVRGHLERPVGRRARPGRHLHRTASSGGRLGQCRPAHRLRPCRHHRSRVDRP